MNINSAAQWLSSTQVSEIMRDNFLAVPAVQSIHICAIALLVGCALMSEMRMVELLATDIPRHTIMRRYLPGIWGGMAILLLTGFLLITSEPERSLGNTVFWLKMGLVSFGVLLSLVFRKPYMQENFQPQSSVRKTLTKPVAWLSLAVWIAVIFSGRFIAYIG